MGHATKLDEFSERFKTAVGPPLEIMCMHLILSGHHTSLHICNHICHKKLQYNFPKWWGGSKAVWNLSKNSSNLVAPPFPKQDICISDILPFFAFIIQQIIFHLLTICNIFPPCYSQFVVSKIYIPIVEYCSWFVSSLGKDCQQIGHFLRFHIKFTGNR